MRKSTVEKILTENVKFYPPKQIIEFVIDDGTETTGVIEECDNPKCYSLYIDGDEYGCFNTVEEAKAEIASYAKKVC